MDNLIQLITALNRCEIDDVSRTYNGITMKQSEYYYDMYLSQLYHAAALEYATAQCDKEVINRRIKQVAQSQQYFNVPSMKTIERLKLDYNSSGAPSLKADFDFCAFVRECYRRQIYYMSELLILIGEQCPVMQVEAVKEENAEAEAVQDNNSELIEPLHLDVQSVSVSDTLQGVRGLATFLSCGANKAQGILNSGILQEKGVARQIGRTWLIDSSKLKQILSEEPKLLANIPACRGRKMHKR